MNLSDTIWHEWRTVLSRPAALMSLVLLVCMLAYGVYNGRREQWARAAAIASHEAEVAATTATWLSELRQLEERGPGAGVPPWAGSAMDATLPSSLPPAPLADFAIGQSDLLPFTGAVSLWDPDIRLFSRYEFDDPVALALGAFDLSKAIIFVLPLLLIVLSFDALSADRDSGRLGLVLAQGASIRRLLWSRLLVRAAAVLCLTYLVACLALVVPTSTMSVERLPFFVLWSLATLLYSAFWIAFIAFVASSNRSSAVNLTGLLLAWVGFTLLLPACVASVTEALYPTPSRLAYLAEAREVEIETELTEADAANKFVLDHPDLVIDEASQMPAYVRTAFLATKAVDDATRPILLSFESAVAGRERALELLRYLSPAIVTHGALIDISGSSARRHQDYMAAARALKAEYAHMAGRHIMAGRRLPLAQASALPRISQKHESASALLARNAGSWAFLALTSGFLLLLSAQRLRRAALGS